MSHESSEDHFYLPPVLRLIFYKRKITLRVREEEIIFKSVKPASSLIKRVYMLSLRERIELDLEARLMGETLVLNRSLNPFLEDYIELNDLNEPFELRRNQRRDDLIPAIEEAGDKKIHIEMCSQLKFHEERIEFTTSNFFPLLYVNVMSKNFHNSIMKDKMMYKGDNVVGALMNVSIFVGTFSVVSDFAVLEDMDAYRDEGMGDVIFGEPFLKRISYSLVICASAWYLHNGSIEYHENSFLIIYSLGSGYHQKDRKPSQNDKTEHGMEKTVQNQGQSPKMPKSESILKNQQSNRSRN
ncbi:hypothetical protein Tco_1099235 [Tanacetum coccineum]